MIRRYLIIRLVTVPRGGTSARGAEREALDHPRDLADLRRRGPGNCQPSITSRMRTSKIHSRSRCPGPNRERPPPSVLIQLSECVPAFAEIDITRHRGLNYRPWYPETVTGTGSVPARKGWLASAWARSATVGPGSTTASRRWTD